MDVLTAAGTYRAVDVGAELDGRFEEMSLCLRQCPSIPASSARCDNRPEVRRALPPYHSTEG
jgi:hypothetical protein